MHATTIATGAPVWVYIVLGVLVVLGVRRLKTREVPLPVALIPMVAFLMWSLLGLKSFAAHAGFAPAIMALAAGAIAGVLSSILLPDPQGERLPGGRVRQPGSPIPLVLYLGVFIVRFVCGAWAAIHPAQATTATAIGIAVSTIVTARLVMGVLKWKALPANGMIA